MLGFMSDLLGVYISTAAVGTVLLIHWKWIRPWHWVWASISLTITWALGFSYATATVLDPDDSTLIGHASTYGLATIATVVCSFLVDLWTRFWPFYKKYVPPTRRFYIWTGILSLFFFVLLYGILVV